MTALRCGGDDPASKASADSGISADAGFDVTLDGSSWSDSGSDAADGSTAEVGADSAPAPPPGNALLRSDGSVLALYPVGAGALPTRATAFERSGDDLALVDEVGVTLWKKNVGAGSLFGGFDHDADGVVDAGLVRSKDSGQTCGGKPMLDTWLEVVSGKDGTVTSLQPPQPAKCWTFPTATYPTEQWTGIDVLFGSKRVLSLQAYYATDGAFLEHGGSGFQKLGSYVYPSTRLNVM